MNLLCLVILVSSLSFVHVVLQEEVVESVARRFSGDSYTLSNTTGQRICHDDGNLTLLVDERRCIKNEELFNGI